MNHESRATVQLVFPAVELTAEAERRLRLLINEGRNDFNRHEVLSLFTEIEQLRATLTTTQAPVDQREAEHDVVWGTREPDGAVSSAESELHALGRVAGAVLFGRSIPTVLCRDLERSYGPWCEAERETQELLAHLEERGLRRASLEHSNLTDTVG